MKRGFLSLLILLVVVLFVVAGCTFDKVNNSNIDISKGVAGLKLILGKVIGCVSDTDCSDSTPICIDGTCGCFQDSDCSGGKICDLEIDMGQCISKGDCFNDNDCFGDTRWCELEAKKCVQCYEQEHCIGDLICNFETNKCEEPVKEEPLVEESTEEESVNDKLPLAGQAIFPPEEGINCEDTDEGKDYSKRSFSIGKYTGSDKPKRIGARPGIIEDTNQNFSTYFDYCVDKKILHESYCADKKTIGIDIHECENGCYNGICIEIACKEGGDEGSDKYTKGVTEGNEDKCFEDPQGVLKQVKACKSPHCSVNEWWCDPGIGLQQTKLSCPYGCQDGACLKEQVPCEDSDGGINLFEKGMTTGIFQGSLNPSIIARPGGDFKKQLMERATVAYDTYHDHCYGNQLNEAFCDKDGKMSAIDRNCEFGCEDGACLEKPKITCEDSDAGDDTSQAGTVKYKDVAGTEQTFIDKCIGLIGVLEGQCNNDGTFACLDESKCRRRCSPGEICDNGACIASKAQCIDSDGGENKNQMGTVTFGDSNEKGKHETTIKDICMGYRFVNEVMCNSVNFGRTKMLKCEENEVCSDGACIASPEKCVDSDGKDRTTKGITTYTLKNGKSEEFIDSCSNSAYIVEGLCKVNTFMGRMVPCPVGKVCVDGVCVGGKPEVKFSCKDSDGFDLYVAGTIDYTDETGAHKKTDTCSSSQAVSENYCVGNNLKTYDNRLCPSGYNCAAGKCVKV